MRCAERQPRRDSRRCQGSGEPPISGYGVSLWRQGDVLELTVVMGDGVKPCKKPLARVESE